MCVTFITRWILTLNEHNQVNLQRKLVPLDNPLQELIEEDGQYHKSIFTLYDRNFSVIYKEEEKENVKSVIYVGKLQFVDGKQIPCDLEEADEMCIEALANIFLREDHSQMH